MSMGRRLRTLRKNASLTQQKLADNVGVSRIYIQALESNRRMPSVKLLYRLSTALSANVTDIVDEYPAKAGRIQLEEFLSPGDADVWFRKKKLSESELRRVERVLDAVLTELDQGDSDGRKGRRDRRTKSAE